MAASGNKSVAVTKYDTLKFSWWEGTQSIANNQTPVNWKLELISGAYGHISSGGTKPWKVTVNGTEYSGSVNVGIANNATKVLASGTTTIKHNDNGEKTFSYSFSQSFSGITFNGVALGTVSGSGNGTLTTIPRRNTLTAGNGTLGKAQTLTVDKKADAFTHTIAYKCGGLSGTICTKSGSTSVSWTPPLNLATQAPNANSVAVTLTIETFSGSTSIGSSTESITCDIPYTNDFIPVLLPSISDATGYADKYGWVQGMSKLKVDIETYGAYGATIKSIKTVFDGATFTTTSATSNVISKSGVMPVKITVTDSRGRTTEVSPEITVHPYEAPKITAATAVRCDENGNPDSSGAYLLVKLSATVSGLNGNNNATYWIGYKKPTEADHTAVMLAEIKNTYSVTDHTHVIPAETASSYTIIVTAIDDFKQTTIITTGPSCKKLFSVLKKAGKIVGAAFGKIAELEGVLEIAWQTRLSGGILHPVLADRSDLDTLRTPTTYMMLSANSYTHAPVSSVGGFLEIIGIKDTSIVQRFTAFNTTFGVWERMNFGGSWSEWTCIRGDFVVAQGVTNGWTWRKWHSGVAECWKIHTFTTTINTAFGSLYCGNATARQEYPFPFVEKPVENVTLQSGAKQAILYCEAGGHGVNGVSSSARYNVFHPVAVTTSQTFYLSFHVRGKWK